MIWHPSWKFLSVLATAKGQRGDKIGKVEFVARYFLAGEEHELHEVSRFKRYKGAWKYMAQKKEREG